MNIIQELSSIRAALDALCQMTDMMILSYQNSDEEDNDRENIYPFSMDSSFFKGKSVAAIIFQDGKRMETATWLKFIETIMKDCNDDKHEALMSLRDRVLGRNRVLLGSKLETMRKAIKIDEGLYLEGHYDTETLIKIVKKRILDVVGYDYSGIKVVIS